MTCIKREPEINMTAPQSGTIGAVNRDGSLAEWRGLGAKQKAVLRPM